MNVPDGDTLYGRDLLELSSDVLVARYNEALIGLGLEPSSLPRFRIDGRGWSPEIAVELGNAHYLSHGPANPLGVVVSPDQAGRPLYAPIHSFEAPLLRDYHARYRGAIAELTRGSAIALDLEQELSRYSSPADLLLVREVMVRSYAGPLSRAAQQQSELVARFEAGEWADPGVRRALLDSARRHGDLRFKELTVPEMPFAGVRDFYADVFGGVFVLRAPGSDDEYLILRSEDEVRSRRLRGSMWLFDPELVEQLIAAGFVEVGLADESQELARLRTLLTTLTVGLLSEADPEADLEQLLGPQRKRHLQALDGAASEELLELEALVVGLERGRAPDPERLSLPLTRLLLTPHRALGEGQRSVVAQLLLHLAPNDMAALYHVDRAHFYQLYAGWPAARRQWAQRLLSPRPSR